jgi:Phage regulatory protein CII (CP76)
MSSVILFDRAPAVQDVNDAAYRIGHRFPGGVPALAQRMGVNPSTLNHKLNINNESHHLSVSEAVALQHAAGDCSILYAMAWQLEHVAVPVPGLPVRGEVAMKLVQLGREVGDVFAKAEQALSDGEVTPNERREIAQEVSEVIAVLGQLLKVL